jgi:hypothetical protein
MAHRSHDTEETKVKNKLKDLQDNIDASQLLECKVEKCQNLQPKDEVPHRDSGLGNDSKLPPFYT